MEAVILERPEMNLIGFFYAGPFDSLHQGVPQIARRLQECLGDIPNKRDPLTRLELSVEDPNGTYTIFACTEVVTFSRIPVGMVGFTVPALTYAHVRHAGALPEVPQTYMKLFSWITQNGYERLSSFHSMERYHSDSQSDTVDIFIPILPSPAG